MLSAVRQQRHFAVQYQYGYGVAFCGEERWLNSGTGGSNQYMGYYYLPTLPRDIPCKDILGD